VTDHTDPSAVERTLAAYYDQEAADRAERPLEPERIAARTRFIAQLGEQNGPLLEVGPGAGRDSAAFVDAGMAVTGVDLSHQQLAHAAGVGLTGVVASVRHLPFPDDRFSTLWTMSTLMHVPDSAIIDALTELRRVLTPGAVAAIGAWGGPDVESPGDKGRYGPRLFSRRSDARWRAMLATLGTVEEFENWHQDLGDFWYQWAVVTTAG
jgi:SAM-dependent methyltransferase